MSTEVLEKGNAVDLQALVEFIQDECLDIVDDKYMTAERFARLVHIIGNRVRFCSKRKVADFSFKIDGKEYAVRVNNNLKGFVSVSCDGETGMSTTEYFPFYSDVEDGFFTGYCCLAQMVNEAWYLCTANGDNLGVGVI